jgi:voltage-gated potassium channel
MVIITVSTVGFREVQPLSDSGRVFTVIFISLAIGTVGFSVAQLVEFTLEGHLEGFRRMRSMQKRIDALDGHYIVCGYGRVGQEVVTELLRKHAQILVIDLKPPEFELNRDGVPFIQGNATSEEVLTDAGIQRARGLIAAMDSDTENVFTVLTARTLKPGLFLIARASEPGTTRKLKMVGADRVVSPYVTSGRRMAAMATHPEVVEFLEHFTSPLEGIELELGSVMVEASSELEGKSLAEADLRRRCGAMVIAVRRETGMKFNPDAGTRLERGQKLMVLGTRDQLSKLEQMARGAGGE